MGKSWIGWKRLATHSIKSNHYCLQSYVLKTGWLPNASFRGNSPGSTLDHLVSVTIGLPDGVHAGAFIFKPVIFNVYAFSQGGVAGKSTVRPFCS